MNLENYNEEILYLSNQAKEYLDNYDRKIFTTLRKLEKAASEFDDHALDGYIYFLYAAAYYDHSEHNNFFKSLSKSIYHLLRCDEVDSLLMAYNLFAIEAQRFGCFSIALHYYKLADSLASDNVSATSAAAIHTNLGGLLNMMEDKENAINYVEKAIEVFKQYDDLNLVFAYVNYAIILLDNNQVEKALKVKKIIDKLEHQDEPIVKGWLIILNAILALVTEDDQSFDKYLEDIKTDVMLSAYQDIYIQDIYTICEIMITKKKWKQAESLFKVIEGKLNGVYSTYQEYLLIQLMIDYYKELKDYDKLLEYYDRRNILALQLERDHNLINYESICLMRMIGELDLEKQKVDKENIELQQTVETDALTKIPNRYSLTRTIEEIYEKSLTNQTNFGIGVVDINNFKIYNDNYGHLVGDSCLIKVAKTLEEIAIKHNGYVARYGGDEFVLIYDNLTNQQIDEIENQINTQMHVPVTHGYYNAIPNENIKSWDYFIKADEVLYQKKKSYHEPK